MKKSRSEPSTVCRNDRPFFDIGTVHFRISYVDFLTGHLNPNCLYLFTIVHNESIIYSLELKPWFKNYRSPDGPCPVLSLYLGWKRLKAQFIENQRKCYKIKGRFSKWYFPLFWLVTQIHQFSLGDLETNLKRLITYMLIVFIWMLAIAATYPIYESTVYRVSRNPFSAKWAVLQMSGLSNKRLRENGKSAKSNKYVHVRGPSTFSFLNRYTSNLSLPPLKVHVDPRPSTLDLIWRNDL